MGSLPIGGAIFLRLYIKQQAMTGVPIETRAVVVQLSFSDFGYTAGHCCVQIAYL
jgi:hypothetical protein